MKKTKIDLLAKPKSPVTKINELVCRRVLAVVDRGLTMGIGDDAIPGKMCVEAAVCYAMGEKHNDAPRCVSNEISEFKIALNDRVWEGDNLKIRNRQRAKWMRGIAIAQLGSIHVSPTVFERAVATVLIEALVGYLTELYRTKKNDTLLESVLRALSVVLGARYTVDYILPLELLVEVASYSGILQLAGYTRGLNKHNRFIADFGSKALVRCNTTGSKFLYLLDPATR